MATHLTIRQRAETERILYYPELSYLTGDHWGDAPFDASTIARHVAKHLRHLKLSALVFDRIFLPVGHLVFQPTEFYSRVVISLLCHREFRTLAEAGRIVTDAWDTSLTCELFEHRAEYARGIDWLHVPVWSSEAVATVEQFTPAPRNVTAQSSQLGNDFGDYITQHKSKAVAASMHEVEEIRKASSYKDIVPFSHELFVLKMREAAERSPFAKAILGATHRLYWKRASADYGTAVYHYEDGSGLPPWRTKLGLSNSREVSGALYSPQTTENFFRVFLGDRVALIYELPMHELLQQHRCFWHSFVHAYHEMLEAIHEVFSSDGDEAISGERFVEIVKRCVVFGDGLIPSGFTEFATAFAGFLLSAAGAQTGTGPIMKGMTTASKYWENNLALFLLRFRRDDIFYFLDQLRDALKQFETRRNQRLRVALNGHAHK